MFVANESKFQRILIFMNFLELITTIIIVLYEEETKLSEKHSRLLKQNHPADGN